MVGGQEGEPSLSQSVRPVVEYRQSFKCLILNKSLPVNGKQDNLCWYTVVINVITAMPIKVVGHPSTKQQSEGEETGFCDTNYVNLQLLRWIIL